MDRFRPNLVFKGCEPYDEDKMSLVKMGDVRIQGVESCARCRIVTVNQTTADISREPLRTLATYRRIGNGVMFGRYFASIDEGQITVGMTVEGV